MRARLPAISVERHGGAGEGAKIDLRIRGAYSYLSAAGVNTGSGGMFEFYKFAGEYGGYPFAGGYEPVHGGYDFGVDIIFPLSSRFGIGIGAGYLRSSGNYNLSLTINTREMILKGKTALSAVPVRLGLFFTLPLGGRLSLTANSGAAYYAALHFYDHYRFDQSVFWGSQDIGATGWSFSDNLGLQGGLGFEFATSAKTGIFIEAQGRYARFENFSKATTTVASAEGGAQTREGKIYMISQNYDVFVWNTFTVVSTPPTPNPPDYLVSEPKFDFSGFCIQAGFRIRL